MVKAYRLRYLDSRVGRRAILGLREKLTPSLSIAVKHVPEVTIAGGPEQFAVVGKQILLTCQYNAFPPATEVLWIKDGTVLARNTSVKINNSRVTIPHHNETHEQLSITATTSQDAGNYTCLVINDVGNSWDTISMISQGVFYCTKLTTCSG